MALQLNKFFASVFQKNVYMEIKEADGWLFNI